jgi:hypothetical protein
MSFDVQTMLSVSPTLRVLIASDCGITDTSAAGLPPLPQLRKLDLSSNALEVVECVEVLIKSAPRLMSVELHGNPLCKGHTGTAQKYRDAMILMSDSLASLDGEQITEQQRSFLLRLYIKKFRVRFSSMSHSLLDRHLKPELQDHETTPKELKILGERFS